MVAYPEQRKDIRAPTLAFRPSASALNLLDCISPAESKLFPRLPPLLLPSPTCPQPKQAGINEYASCPTIAV